MKNHPVRILIVEDNALIARNLQGILIRAGYEVAAVVASREMAVQQARTAPPDLILMDIQLAGEMDGIEAAEYIRTEADIPIVYLTAYSGESLVERAKTAEPVGYALKPFQEEELRIAVDIALYKHDNYAALKDTNLRLNQEMTTRKRIESDLRKRTEVLRERVKELNCLYQPNCLARPGNIRNGRAYSLRLARKSIHVIEFAFRTHHAP